MYALFIVLILVTMCFRRETPLVCIVGSLVLSWVVTGDLIKAVQAVFNSITVAASDLLGVVVIISLIVAMAKMLEETGIAGMMFNPIQGIMKTPAVAFWVMGFTILIVAWIIWPSPAIALVGALLLPAAIKVGLPPIGAAMAISMFGYGCALTTDFIIQGAPGITAKAAGIAPGDVMVKSVPMLIVWAAIALPLSFRSILKDIRAGACQPVECAIFERPPAEEAARWQQAAPGFKRVALVVIAALFLLDIVSHADVQAARRGCDRTSRRDRLPHHGPHRPGGLRQGRLREAHGAHAGRVHVRHQDLRARLSDRGLLLHGLARERPSRYSGRGPRGCSSTSARRWPRRSR